jgi:hypothetical protein
MNKIQFKNVLLIILGIIIFSFTSKNNTTHTYKETNLRKDSSNKFNKSFIGKHTDDKYINSLFECWGSLVAENENEIEDSIAICSVSTKQEKCNIGKFKILFQRLLFRKKNGFAVFVITDELLFENYNLKINTGLVDLKTGDSKNKKTYLIRYIDSKKKTINKILFAWSIDFKKGKFKPIKLPSKIKFDNPNYFDE